MKKIRIDVGMCTGCGQCALTCAFKNVDSFDLRQSSISIVQWEDICLSVPLVCQQCKEAACISACPTEAISNDPLTGAIVIDRDLCNLCYNCVEECTYQVIHIAPKDEPVTCDLCSGNPKCVLACYPQALSYEFVPDEEWEPFSEISQVLVARAMGRNVPPPEELADQRIGVRRSM
jgi:carbon-monoxide dehydrogenase iron sulfur subunit